MKNWILGKIQNIVRIMIYKFGFFIISDKLYLKISYWAKMGKKINFDNPVSYTEKIQWLKLNYYKPEFTKMADKIEAKNIVSNIIGDDYVIPSLGVWNNFEEIDFNLLPKQFVLKTNHDSGGVVVCKDKSKFNIENAKRLLSTSLKKKYYYCGRELPYKGIKPKILAEKYLVDESKQELKDYKFFCFNGEPKLLFVAQNRHIETKFDFFDMQFHKLNIKNYYKNSSTLQSKPKNFELMIELAKKLSKGLPHIRIDFYNISGKIYFGEYTFHHFGGYKKFEPEEWDYEIGSWLKLPEKNR